MIRLWYDNAALDKYAGNPEAPHTIICGDTNASRLRVLINQYFHPSRDPNELAPIVILAEGKAEGALKALLEEHKHSKAVTYIRGSGRRTADLKRAGAMMASTAIVLNYRSDRDPTVADTEVLSTVMALKNVKPNIRVLAQLHRAKKRNQLKLVPGFSDADRAVAGMSIGATVLGLSTHIPGFATLVTNLIRRGIGAHSADTASVKAKVETGWRVALFGESALPADNKETSVSGVTTPLDEYAASIDAQVYELPVTPQLCGRSFAAAARVAYLRYGITLIGATVPVNEQLSALIPGIPRTYRMSLYPSTAILCDGMKLYAVAADETGVEAFRVETGGRTRNALEQIADSVKFLPFELPSLPGSNAAAGSASSTSNDGVAVIDAEGAAVPIGVNINLPGMQGLNGLLRGEPGSQYGHNRDAAADISLPWCFKEHDYDGSSSNAFLRALHIPVFTSERAAAAAGGACETCGKAHAAAAHDGSAIDGCAIVTGSGIANIATGADSSKLKALTNGTSIASSITTATAAAASTGSSAEGGASAADALAIDPATVALAAVGGGRRPSLGDDGFGGLDETGDILGPRGPLMTQPPVLHSASAGLMAATAAAANMASLAVRLALPAAAGATEDLTLVNPGAGAAAEKGVYSSHVLICGVNDNIGYILRAIASLLTKQRQRMARHASRQALTAGSGSPSSAPSLLEGDQYDLRPSDVVILAPAKPADASINACYPGSSRLLSKVTFISGSPSDAGDLLKAGIMTARTCLILTQSKATVTADGSDNLSDDTEAIMATAVTTKLNPALHVISEVLHGSHAPFIRPTGSTLNDAQRSAFSYVLEEREAARMRMKLDDAIRQVEQEAHITAAALMSATVPSKAFATPAAYLLAKLVRQQVRLRTLHPTSRIPRALMPHTTGRNGAAASAAASAGTGLDARATDGLGGGRHMDIDGDIDVAFSGLTNAAIVDVLVGVKEDFSSVSAAATEGASFSSGGGSGAGGSSKGSGATNDLYTSPAFASGRVFSFATVDSIITEARFEPYITQVVKGLIRAARRGRLMLIPVAEAIVMCRLAAAGGAAAAQASGAGIDAARMQYLSELVAKMTPNGAAAASSSAPSATAFEHYGPLFESLMRCFRLLPIGLYRRVGPAAGLKTSPSTLAAVSAAAGLPSLTGDAFVYNRALVSYVFTNPPPATKISEHDLIYVMADDDEAPGCEAGAGAVGAGAGWEAEFEEQ